MPVYLISLLRPCGANECFLVVYPERIGFLKPSNFTYEVEFVADGGTGILSCRFDWLVFVSSEVKLFCIIAREGWALTLLLAYTFVDLGRLVLLPLFTPFPHFWVGVLPNALLGLLSIDSRDLLLPDILSIYLWEVLLVVAVKDSLILVWEP